MSGVRRFLSRREKSPHAPHLLRRRDNAHASDSSSKPVQPPAHFGGVFVPLQSQQKKPEKDDEKKIKGILERLRHYGIDNITEANVEYALRARSSQGDPEATFRLLMLLEDTYEGIIRPYDPSVRLLGAVNRDGVTCYLDALLFAMFVRLDSFEAMLYENFEDARRKRLAGLIRLWVNLLRTGRVVTTDLTEHIQRSLASCGWADAAKLQQQDPSEAFTFITGQLELPMLTLKMDMFHVGKEDPQDDHKFVNERLLEVAILDEPVDGKSEITLEDCLEHYFNNRIEVKRHLENQRRNTLKSVSTDGPTKVEKESGVHVEVVDVVETPLASPAVGTPITEVPAHNHATPVERLRPDFSRKRADSIFSQRKLELTGANPAENKSDDVVPGSEARLRKMSTRTEVLMPAWQFFKLLPWYTANMPTSDAQVAAHFAKKRPVLGICLKRYSYTNTGQARKLDTYVDIPLEIAVPNFVSDDHLHEDGPLVGNFTLMLQSVVCHRGVSLHSGHYVCLSRGRVPLPHPTATLAEHRGSNDSDNLDDAWMRFDDLAQERVVPVDIHEALKQEMPYLLFYQVQPIGDDGSPQHDLPTYEEANPRSQSDVTPLEKAYPAGIPLSDDHPLEHVNSEPVPISRSSVDVSVAEFTGGAERTSLNATTVLCDLPRGRPNPEPTASPRQSITIDTSSISGSTSGEPMSSTPSEDNSHSGNSGNAFLAVANQPSTSRRGSKSQQQNVHERSRSRPSSREENKRFSLNMSKLTQIVSNNTKVEGATAGTAAQGRPAEQEAPIAGDAPSRRQSVDKLSYAPGSTTFPLNNGSKESFTATGKSRPKIRRERMSGGAGGRKRRGPGHHKQHEDRDCAVM